MAASQPNQILAGGDVPQPPTEILAAGEVKQQTQKMTKLDVATELANIRKRLRYMEEESEVLRAKQAKLFAYHDQIAASATSSAADTNGREPTKEDTTQMRAGVDAEEIDALSIFVGNVDYECTVEDVCNHFRSCGTLNRVTIPIDEYGNPKGFSYIEFAEDEAVEVALQLNESELHGRKLKVMRKRKNVPGMRQHRPWHYYDLYDACEYGHPPPFFYPPYGHYGPRFQGPQ